MRCFIGGGITIPPPNTEEKEWFNGTDYEAGKGFDQTAFSKGLDHAHNEAEKQASPLLLRGSTGRDALFRSASRKGLAQCS